MNPRALLLDLDDTILDDSSLVHESWRDACAGQAGRLGRQPLPAPRIGREQLPQVDAAKLGGVPLSAFPACRTDQREDTLKLALIAAVGKKRECSSAAGTYRFVETKNLNAFLMWIERAPGRPAVDRCGELTHALNCLSRPGAT